MIVRLSWCNLHSKPNICNFIGNSHDFLALLYTNLVKIEHRLMWFQNSKGLFRFSSSLLLCVEKGISTTCLRSHPIICFVDKYISWMKIILKKQIGMDLFGQDFSSLNLSNITFLFCTFIGMCPIVPETSTPTAVTSPPFLSLGNDHRQFRFYKSFNKVFLYGDVVTVSVGYSTSRPNTL